LIRALGLAGPSGANCEETEARRIMAEAALKQLNKVSEEAEPDSAPLYDDLKEHYRRRLSSLPLDGEDQDGSEAETYAKFLAVSLELLRIERETAVNLRNSGRINDETLRQLLQELDLSETRFHAA
jgi:monovalent cation/hydrogen antiporter